MYISPSYKLAKYVFEIVCSAITEKFQFLKKNGINKSDLKIIFSNNSYIEFVSASETIYDNLRGRSADYAVIDESALISDDAYRKVLRPIFLLSKQVICCSTPLGKDSWFYELYQEGLIEGQTKYKSFHKPTSSNPLISSEEIEDMKRLLPDMIFRQEVEAEFLETGEGSVFKNFKDCIIDKNKIKPSGKYVAGIDVGRSEDYTVLSIIDINTHKLVYINRWNKAGYSFIVNSVAGILNTYKPIDCWVETNSIGDVFFDNLKEKYTGKLTSFYTLNKNKQEIIESLIVDFETKSISIYDYEPLINELGTFGIEFSRSKRNVVYKGIRGSHDDTVMSLAFANAAYNQHSKHNKLSYFIGKKKAG
jgi:phage FluMu gp28-like protein